MLGSVPTTSLSLRSFLILSVVLHFGVVSLRPIGDPVNSEAQEGFGLSVRLVERGIANGAQAQISQPASPGKPARPMFNGQLAHSMAEPRTTLKRRAAQEPVEVASVQADERPPEDRNANASGSRREEAVRLGPTIPAPQVVEKTLQHASASAPATVSPPESPKPPKPRQRPMTWPMSRHVTAALSIGEPIHEANVPTTGLAAPASEASIRQALEPQTRQAISSEDVNPSTGSQSALVKSVLSLLMPRLNYPRLARRHGWEGTVKVQMSFGPRGLSEEPRVLESSGHAVLDRAALAGVQDLKASGLDRDLAEGLLTRLVVPVEYRLVSGS